MFKLLKRGFNSFKEFIVEEYKFLFCLAFFYIVCTWPVNYYIIIGGGISDVKERIVVEDGYDSKGSFNLSYVSELKGTVLSYLLSYVIPTWDRESMDDYKYSNTDSYDDIEFRGDIDLKSTNASAVKVAYSLAGKSVEEISSKIYVIAVFDEYKTNFLVGDELVSIDEQIFNDVSEYSEYVQKFSVGDVVNVKVIRDGKEKLIKCKIYEEKERKIFGISLQVVREYKTEPKIKINFKSEESGPSGGLITTLEIYDQLFSKDITNSKKIAGTGTVDIKGNVGDIGGVRYKLIGAAAGDADIFLVPNGKNYEEAIKVKKEKKLDIEVIGVSTVEEALKKLQESAD